jgi:hypothetical protein
MNLGWDHPPARRETLRRAGLSTRSELTASQAARADQIPAMNLACRSWWTFILHGPAEPKQEPTESDSQARSDRRRVQRAAERRRRAERTRTIRRCECGCGKKIPSEADPRQKFIDPKHRFAHHNRNGVGQPTTPDTLRVSAERKPHGNAESEGSKNEFCNSGRWAP